VIPRRSIAIALLAIVATGCGSQLGFGRARTLDAGKTEIGAGGEFDFASAGQGTDATLPVPWAHATIRAHHGVHDRVELGARAWGFGFPKAAATFGFAADAKIGVYKPTPDESKWNVATGLSASYHQILFAGAPNHVFGVMIPVLFGYQIRRHELVFGPRVADFVSTSYGQETIHSVWPGASLGFAFSATERVEIFPEMVIMHSPLDLNGEAEEEDRRGITLVQLGTGVNLKFP
jgi:hypothetical protein